MQGISCRRVSILAISLLAYLGAPGTSFALYPGDCGKPGTNSYSTSATLSSSDALAVLKASVGQTNCSTVICDTDGNGKVGASDALLVLRAAVGQAVTLKCSCWTDATKTTLRKYCADVWPQVTCTTNSDCSGSGKPCEAACVTTKQDFLTKLAQDPAFTSQPAPGIAVMIDAPNPPETWTLSDSEWTLALKRIEANNVWIHGATDHPDPANNPNAWVPRVTLAPASPCYAPASINDPDNDCGDKSDDSTDANALFLRFGTPNPNGPGSIGGNNDFLVGLGVTGFYEGIKFSGTNSKLGLMLFDRVCDSTISTKDGSSAFGNEVHDSTMRRGCDKCVEEAKGADLEQCSSKLLLCSNGQTCNNNTDCGGEQCNTTKTPHICTNNVACASNEDCCPTTNSRCFHTLYKNVQFQGCEKSIRLSTLAANGTFLFDTITDGPLQYCSSPATPAKICSSNSDCALYTCSNAHCSNNNAACAQNADCGVANCNVTMTCSNDRTKICALNSDCPGGTCTNSPWLCRGGEYGVSGVASKATALNVTGCTTGLTLGNGRHTLGGFSQIVNNLERGLVIQGDSGVATVTQTKIVGNGLSSTNANNDGGVVLTETATPVLGTSTDPGYNCIYDNKKGGSLVQVNSLRTNNPTPLVSTEKNYWNGQQSNNLRHCTVDPELHPNCIGDNGSGSGYCCPVAGCTCNLTTHICDQFPGKNCNGHSDCTSKCSGVSIGTVLTTRPAACP